MNRTFKVRALALLTLTFLVFAASADEHRANVVAFNIDSQPLNEALNLFAQQAGLQLVLYSTAGQGLTAPRLSGAYSPKEALKHLLADTPLDYEFTDERSIIVRVKSKNLSPSVDATELRSGSSEVRLAQNPAAAPTVQHRTPQRNEGREEGLSIPEILVDGSRILNTDIKRTADDIQPYVILDRARIEQSGAANIGEFLKERLPMNSVGLTNGQNNTSFGGNTSQINVRGLGSSQTLILIDGRRLANSTSSGNSFSQPDVNAIPLAAIERIEVLPTTASAIYGGGATGGVINIILRRDYQGAELKATYGNTFKSNAAAIRVDFGAGFELDGGKTNLMLSGSYAEQDSLSLADRDFVAQRRQIILANNPGFYLPLTAPFPNPPLGATPNIRSSNGSALFGPGTSNFTSVPVGYVGGGGLAALRVNAGRYNFDLADSTQVTGGGRSGLLNGPTIKSGMVTLSHDFSSRIRTFIEAAVTDNTGYSPATLPSGTFTLPLTAATNPFGQAVVVTVPILQSNDEVVSSNRNIRVAGGISFSLPHEWHAGLDFTWNRFRNDSTVPGSTLAAASTAISSGTLDILRDPNAVLVNFGPYIGGPTVNGPFHNTLKDTNLRLAGPTFKLPAGPLMVSMLVENQDEDMGNGFQRSPTTTLLYPSRSQSIKSLYLEAKVPLVSSKQNVPGIRDLELQVSGRWDRYAVTGSTGFVVDPTPSSIVDYRTNKNESTNPTVGMGYRPIDPLRFRASYGTGFLPPSVSQLVPNPPDPAFSPVIDPRRGSVSTFPNTIFSGGNPDLRSEQSESFSAGMVMTADKMLRGLRISLDYIRITKQDEIRTLSAQQIVDNEAYLPGRVSRAASAPGTVGAITSIDVASVNAARTRVEAIDFALDYDHETSSRGAFNFFLAATHQLHYWTQLAPASPLNDMAGVTSSFPLEWKGNAGVGWKFGAWGVQWSSTYLDSYLVADPSAATAPALFANQGSKYVRSQHYHDLAMTWSPTSSAGGTSLVTFLDKVEIRAGVRNLFDDEPPYDASNTRAFYSVYGDPRLRSYFLSLKKNFE